MTTAGRSSPASPPAPPPAPPPPPPFPSDSAWCPRLLALSLLALMTLGEIRLCERLLYSNRDEVNFVAASVVGIQQGRPVWKAWQHRLLAPGAVAILAAAVGDLRRALRLFADLTLAAANLLLFWILRRKGATLVTAVAGVALFGFGHLLLTFKLEYPWDGVDLLLFLAFGAAVARGRSLLSVAPLLALGTFNHETVFYMPLWYLLAPLDRAPGGRPARPLAQPLMALAASAIIGTIILVVRTRLYVGRPDLPGQDFGMDTAVIANQVHAAHNFHELFIEDMRHGRALLNAGLLVTLALLIVAGLRGRNPRAVAWAAAVVATIFCFGYMSELRLYLVLLAFAFGYAFPVAALQPAPAAPRGRVSPAANRKHL